MFFPCCAHADDVFSCCRPDVPRWVAAQSKGCSLPAAGPSPGALSSCRLSAVTGLAPIAPFRYVFSQLLFRGSLWLQQLFSSLGLSFFWERFVLTSCPIPPPSYSSLGPAPFSLPNSSRKHQPSLVTSLHSHLGDCWLRLTTLDTTTSFCAERELRKSIITAKVPPALSCNGKPNLEQGQLCNLSALKSRNVEKYLGICLTALIIFQ